MVTSRCSLCSEQESFVPVLLPLGHELLASRLCDEQCLKHTAKATECWFADYELLYELHNTEYSGFVFFREIFFHLINCRGSWCLWDK